MNLVAKEYVAAQDPDDPGVLVLSQFAGAARRADRGADRESARHRRHGRSARARARDAARRASGALSGDVCFAAGEQCLRVARQLPAGSARLSWRGVRYPARAITQAAASAPAIAGSFPCCLDSSSRYRPGRSRNSCGEPSSMTLPELITMIRSKFCSVDNRCAIAITGRPTISRSSACWIASSDELSSADVASSSSRIGAFFRIARAIAIRWRCPPESFTPRSPTIVSNPSGIASMKSVQRASRAAASTSSRLASGRPYAMFSYTVR